MDKRVFDMVKESFIDKSFINDSEKMIDFDELSMTEFLESYSYLEEKDYIATVVALAMILASNYFTTK